MKTTISIKTWVLMTLTTLALFACEKDIDPALSPISLDPQTVSVEKDDTVEVMINGGTGPYTTRMDKTGIVSVSINDNILALTGNTEGTTTIRVADAKGSSATLTVAVTYHPAELITFAALKSHLVSGESVELPRAIKIKGVVISDADSKNIDANTAILQEDNDQGGITIQFTAAHTLKLGDEAEVDVSRLTLADVNGELTVTRVPISKAAKTGTGTITAREATAQEIIDNKDAWNNTLVTLPGGFFTGGSGNYTGSLSYDDGTAIVQSHFVAPDFGAYPATGVALLTGIVRVNGSDVRVDIRSLEDVGVIDYSNHFITKWDTGTESTLVLHVIGDCDVVWEKDGDPAVSDSESYTAITTANPPTIDFGSPGIYIIKIAQMETSTGFRLALGTATGAHPEAEKLLEVQQWGTNKWPSALYMFLGAVNMDVTATDKPDMTLCTTLNAMFQGCTNLKGENADFSNWEVGNSTNFYRTFYQCSSFNRPLDNWNTSRSVTYGQMFLGATAFNQPLNSWTIYTGGTSGTGTASMTGMFNGASSFNQPLDNWDTSRINNMSNMLINASSFNQSLATWDLSAVPAHTGATGALNSLNFMLSNTGMDIANYSATLIGWAANTNTPALAVRLGAAGLKYSSAAVAARTTLTDTKGWIIVGDTEE